MAITEPEWQSIRALIEVVSAEVSGNRNFFTTGKVIKRDTEQKLVWIEDFGDQPIPLVAFDFEINYYDETPQGTTAVAAGNAQPYAVTKKKVMAKVQVPKIGETVLVARELGSRRLPRCLGVIMGKGWIVPESE